MVCYGLPLYAAGMGPTDNQDQLRFELRAWLREHPSAIVHSPQETASGRWELSLEGSSCLAFDDLGLMLLALSMTSIPEDD